ncbi:MAG: hypothetical protein IKD75_05595 [Prevotella sp.]|nr:hypothetical protein [Prevotella sp.]
MINEFVATEHDGKRQFLWGLDAVEGHTDGAQARILAERNPTVEEQTAGIDLQTIIADKIGSTDRLYISI